MSVNVCQVVALVFEHVDIERSKQDAVCMATPRSPGSPGARSAQSQAGSDTLHSPGSGALIEHGPANAALKLLDNLCMMLTGLLHLPYHSSSSSQILLTQHRKYRASYLG